MATLRELFEGSEMLVAPGAYDAITAMLAERAGFRAVYMTGAGTVNAHLGVPDISLGSMDDMVQNAGRMVAAVDVPVFCDADTGYGTAVNVIRTVRAFETVGVAGIHLEDQVAPKRCGHLDGKAIVSVGEMVGKIEAAVDARRSDDFFVIARSDSRAVEGLDAAIERAGAYVEAGADAVFPEALTSVEEFEAFAGAGLGVPLMANMTEFGKTPYLRADEFAALGYSAVIFPMAAFRSMMWAVQRVYGVIAETGTQVSLLDEMMTRAELYEVVDYPGWEAASDKYAHD